MKALLILRCDGRQDKDFRFCNGVDNIVLDLETINASSNFTDLIKYLDRVTNIFSEPCFNMNVIMNSLYKIYDYGYLTEEKYKFVKYFYDMHKICGISLKCIPKEF